MRRMGSIIGGVIGFFIGSMFFGPILGIVGALLGSSIGASMDRVSGSQGSFYSQGGNPFQQGQSRTRINSQVFFDSLFSMIGKLVAVDGHVSSEEESTIRSFMTSQLGLDPASQQAAVQIINQAAASSVPFEEYASRFNEAFSSQHQFKELVIDILIRIAAADGNYSTSEDKLIQDAVRIFSFPESAFRMIKNRYVGGGQNRQSGGYSSSGSSFSTDNSLYEILGCSPSDSVADIKKAYRKKVNEFHPDKIASKGLPAEFTEFANKRFREIQEAYDKIRKERQF